MSILERIRKKISTPAEVEPVVASVENADAQNMVDVPEADADPLSGYVIPMAAGEYFPWKGHLFKIKSVDHMEFTAECVGITNARAKSLGVKR
jgi:hypothetical protein